MVAPPDSSYLAQASARIAKERQQQLLESGGSPGGEPRTAAPETARVFPWWMAVVVVAVVLGLGVMVALGRT